MEDEKVSSEILALKKGYTEDPYPSSKKKGVVTESRGSLTRVRAKFY